MIACVLLYRFAHRDQETAVLRDREPSPATVAVRALTLLFFRTTVRAMRRTDPIVGVRFLVGFLAS